MIAMGFKKTALMVSALLLLTGMATATTSFEGEGDRPHIINEQSDVPDKRPDNVTAGPQGQLPTLPEAASDTARQVIDAISNFFSGSGEGSLGQILSDILGSGSGDTQEVPENQTTQ